MAPKISKGTMLKLDEKLAVFPGYKCYQVLKRVIIFFICNINLLLSDKNKRDVKFLIFHSFSDKFLKHV